MSSRAKKGKQRALGKDKEKDKKKPRTAAAPRVAEASSATDAPAPEAVDAEAADAAETAAPAVSEIKELKPRSDAEIAADELAGSAPEEEELVGTVDDVREAAAPASRAQLKRALESLVFVSDQVITAQQLARLVKVKLADVRELLAEISVDYEGRGIELVEVAGGFQFRSAAASAPYVQHLIAQKPTRLTRSQLETLALIAYRQPITRPEIDDVRGVDSGSAIKMLLERELVKILGRKDEAGRPLLYGTTPYFLEFFQMNSMHDLPTLREFTELSSEHRDLFQKKTGEVPDLSAEAEAQEARHVQEAQEAQETQEAGSADEGGDDALERESGAPDERQANEGLDPGAAAAPDEAHLDSVQDADIPDADIDDIDLDAPDLDAPDLDVLDSEISDADVSGEEVSAAGAQQPQDETDLEPQTPEDDEELESPA